MAKCTKRNLVGVEEAMRDEIDRVARVVIRKENDRTVAGAGR
jgi:hypothetical protein